MTILNKDGKPYNKNTITSSKLVSDTIKRLLEKESIFRKLINPIVDSNGDPFERKEKTTIKFGRLPK